MKDQLNPAHEISEASLVAIERRRQWIRTLLLGAVALAFNIGIFLLPIDYGSFGNYAYLGVFLVTLIANATVVIPIPYAPLVARVAAESQSIALLIGAGALGSALGESVGFLVGRSGRGLVQETAFYRWVQRQLTHPWRAWAVLFALAAPPNPAFDVAGLTAGALGLPFPLFLSAVFCGRIIRIGLFAFAGVRWAMWQAS